MLQELVAKSFLVILVVSGLPLVVITATSMVWSFIQAGLQIQEQTIGHLIRLGTLLLLSYFFLSSAVALISNFTTETLESLPLIATRGL